MKMADFRQGKVVWPEKFGVGKPSSLTSNPLRGHTFTIVTLDVFGDLQKLPKT